MDLGYKPDSGMMASMPEGGKDKTPSKAYPSVRLRGAVAKAFCQGAAPGDVLDGTVRVRVVRTEDAVKPRQEYGGNGEPSVELEIEDLELPGISAGAEDEEDESAEGAVDKYLKKKSGEADEDFDEIA